MRLSIIYGVDVRLGRRLRKHDGCQGCRYTAHMTQSPEPRLYDRIYDLVRAIPVGRVTTYGTIGAIVGCPARVVGYAMHHLRHTNHDVPWQRVINARGGISTHGNQQRAILETEGIIFEQDGTVDLLRWIWMPDVLMTTDRRPHE